MSAKRDYYEVLGVGRDADKNTIKKAYRKLAKKYHPDTNQGNAQAAERFKEATEAYNILSDPKKKKMYDQFGHAAFDGSGAASGAAGGDYGGTYGGAYGRNGGGTYQYAGPDGTFHEYHFEGNGDMDDFLKNIFGGSFGGFGGATRSSSKGSRSGFSGSGFGGSGFGGSSFGESGFSGSGFSGSGFGGSGFGRSGSYGNHSQDGADVTAEITVGFDEAAFGCEKVIHLTENNGKAVGKALKVKIPAGIDTGKSIRLRGKGNPGINGGKAGDLLLKVKVASKPGYERKGMDVYTTVRVPFATAVLGGEAKVEALTVAVNKLEEIGNSNACKDARMIEIMNYIQENYIDITLDDLAEKFFLSKPYISKYIKEKSGVTFGELVKKIRMKKARALLKSSNMTVENIALSVGYQNVEHFNRLFKKAYNMTPIQFRNEK